MEMIKILRDHLQQTIDNIDGGNSNISEEDCLKIVEHLKELSNPNEKLSKYQACKMLGISRAKFDNKVAEGIIPKGKHQQGFKEIFWIKKDLENVKDKVSNKK